MAPDDAAAQVLNRVSVASDGTPADLHSEAPALSADGRFVAFDSEASNLVPDDTNGLPDVFVHDRATGLTSRVSVASDGTQGNGSTGQPTLSADGRFVAFASLASNLVPGDTNGSQPFLGRDIFLHDRATGKTTRVSVASDGTQGNGESLSAAVSGDGRFVTFWSRASNLVAGDTNGTDDIFVHDRLTAVTTRVSVASDGAEGNGGSTTPSLSADGRFVAFTSEASNLVPGDTNGMADVFVHDRETGVTTRVSVASDGTQGDEGSFSPALSADGRFVAFMSGASTLVPGDTNQASDVFVHDRQTGVTTRVSVASDGTQGNEISVSPALSADGRFVAFYSYARSLIPGGINLPAFQPQVFVHDRASQTLRPISATVDAIGNGTSLFPALSADGRLAAFMSDASNLVAGDASGLMDIFIAANAEDPVILTVVLDPPASGRIMTSPVGITCGADCLQFHALGTVVALTADPVKYWVFAGWSGDDDCADGEVTMVADRRCIATFAPGPDMPIPVIRRTSVASDGSEADGASNAPALSADGRAVAFHSAASNLVPGDTNGGPDIFVHDRQTGMTTRVSITSSGAEAHPACPFCDPLPESPAISADGRVVTFPSWAPDLVPDDTNESADVFVHDRVTGLTTRVSVATGGTQGDLTSWTATLNANPQDGASDARFVAFSSFATNLTPESLGFDFSDLYVHDRQTGTTTFVAERLQWPRLSADGRLVVAETSTDAPTQAVAVHDLQAGGTVFLSDAIFPNGWSCGSPALSGDGRVVALACADREQDGLQHVYTHDRATGATTLVSVASDGTPGNGWSFAPSLSADGRFVAFESDATNLAPGDSNERTDIFVHDRQTGVTLRLSVAADFTEGNFASVRPALSADGRFVAFASDASNLVPGDGNGWRDIFVVENPEAPPAVTIAATGPSATEAGLATGQLTVSRTGNTAAALTVFYTVTGTATPGSDYGVLPGSVTIPAGAANAAIPVAPIDDAAVEPDESVVVTLNAHVSYAIGAPGSATVMILSDDVSLPSVSTVTIAATAPMATEAGVTAGQLTVSRTGNTAATLTVFYTVGGTAGAGSDYETLPGSVTIPAGAASAAILVTPLDDSAVEADESVVVTLSANAAYAVGLPNSATITIRSDDVPPVSDIDVQPPAWSYGTVPVGTVRAQVFTVTNTGPATLTVTETALVGADPGQFAIVSGGGAFSLAAGDSRPVTIHFVPTATASASAIFRLLSDDPDETPADIPVTGTGSPPATLVASPPTGHYVSRQVMDVGLMAIAPGQTVTGIIARLNGIDVTAILTACLTPGTLASGGQTFRCAGVSMALLQPGANTLEFTAALTGGLSASTTITWSAGGPPAGVIVSPPTGDYVLTQVFDLAILVNRPGRTIVGGRAVLNGVDVTAGLAACVTVTVLGDGSVALICPGVPAALLGPGRSAFLVTLDFDDGSSADHSVHWTVRANSEP
jgi:Tol biopolymer transport system component